MPDHLAATNADLNMLPLRALVAFAARCVRRVQPLYYLPKETKDRLCHIAAVDRAAEFAERIAANGEGFGHNAGVIDDALAAMRAVGNGTVARLAAIAAFHAASAAAQAMHLDAGATRLHVRLARQMAGVAADRSGVSLGITLAAARANPEFVGLPAIHAGYDVLLKFAFSDSQRLLDLNLGTFPDPGQPVDPTESGPLGHLWPEGAPAWYRVATGHKQERKRKRRGRREGRPIDCWLVNECGDDALASRLNTFLRLTGFRVLCRGRGALSSIPGGEMVLRLHRNDDAVAVCMDPTEQRDLADILARAVESFCSHECKGSTASTGGRVASDSPTEKGAEEIGAMIVRPMVRFMKGTS